MEALVAERERGGPYAGIADLASRSGASRAGLERLAWAGALDESRLEPAQSGPSDAAALWRLGVAAGGRALAGGHPAGAAARAAGGARAAAARAAGRRARRLRARPG